MEKVADHTVKPEEVDLKIIKREAEAEAEIAEEGVVAKKKKM